MNDAAVPPAPSRRPRWGRWARRGLVGLVVLVLLAAVFHRPLAHWAIGYFGGRLAERAGLEASWQSSGSVLGRLVFDDVRVTGGEDAVVRLLTVEHVALDYDLWRLRGGGAGTVLDAIVVRRVDAEVDLTRRSGAARSPAVKRGSSTARLPAVRVPKLEIDRVSLRIRLANGVVEVSDFSVTIDPASPGKISVVRLAAPGVPVVVDALGTTSATADSVTLENLALWPEVGLDRLVVQLADLATGQIGVEVAAHQAGAAVSGQGVAALGGEDRVTVEAEAAARDVTHETLAFWGVPDGGMSWSSGAVELRAMGPVMRPDRLTGDLTVSDAALTRPGLPTASITATAGLKDGMFTLAGGRVVAGSGGATVSANAMVPTRWRAVASAAGQAMVEFEAASLDEWVPAAARLFGQASGRAEVTFAQRTLTGASARVDGTDMVVHGLPVESVSTTVTTTDGSRMVVDAEIRLNDSNTVKASGGVEVRGEQKFEVTWEAACRDLSTIPVEARANLPWPTSGTVTSSGTVSGALASIRARDWSQLAGAATIDAASVAMRDASFESLRVRARASGGEVLVEELALRFDAENTVTGNGRVQLGESGASVSGQLRAALPAVARLSGWSTSFGGPGIEAGSATIDWQIGSEPDALTSGGTGTVRVHGLKVDGIPEVLGLEASATQADQSVTLNSLTASAGPWRAEGRASWDGVRIDVPALTAWAGSERVASLSASVPLAGGSEESRAGPVPLDEPVALDGRIVGLDFDRLGTALGLSMPVRGVVEAEARLSGTVRTLAGVVSARVSRLRPAGKDVARLEPATLEVSAALADGQLTMNARALQNPLQPLTFEARASVDAAGLLERPESFREISLAGRLRLAESSLGFLPGWVPEVAAVRGTASLDATVGGTVGRPQWQATAFVSIPEARLAGAALPSVRDLALRIRADEKRISVQEARVMLAGGQLRVLGGVDLSQLNDPQLDLRLRADEVLVIRDDTLSLRANADIAVRGPFSRAAAAGTIDLVRGRVFKEIEFLPLSLPNQLPPPPPPTTLTRTSPPALPPPLDAWTIDLAIRTRDPVRLMGNVARGNVVADLRLAGTGGRPVLTGRATMERMWIRLPFSRLTITEGAIIFTEDSPFDPQIDVLGESLIDRRSVQVRVQGRALDPTVRMTSSPPLPEGEIAALLATGVTTSDLGTRGDEVAGRAAFVVLQQAYRRMFRKSVLSSDDDEPPRLSFEFAFFGSDASRRGLSAVYELNPKWRVIGRVGETGTFRGLLHYLIRFR